MREATRITILTEPDDGPSYETVYVLASDYDAALARIGDLEMLLRNTAARAVEGRLTHSAPLKP